MSNTRTQHATTRTYNVGGRYRVMGLEIGKMFPMRGAPAGSTVTIDSWHGFKGFLPLLNWFGEDEDFIAAHQNFIGGSPPASEPLHAHVDWRFLSHLEYAGIAAHLVESGWADSPESLSTHVLVIDREWMPHLRPRFRRLECKRDYVLPAFETAAWRQPLEAKYACAALANGRCPHRGVSVAAMIQQNGMLVCPAHGLRWKRTGEHHSHI